jgi:FkbH-like protein
LSDFVSHRIGWGDKVEALSEVANELSLGIDSLVFVDDSDVECDAVRQRLPEVEVVQVPVTEPWRLTEMLANSWFFDTLTITSDDHNRSSEYKAQIQRQVLQENTTSREDFLRSLGIVCTFIDVQQAPLARVVQLLAKTNQFNLTTRRHSATEVLAFD